MVRKRTTSEIPEFPLEETLTRDLDFLFDLEQKRRTIVQVLQKAYLEVEVFGGEPIPPEVIHKALVRLELEALKERRHKALLGIPSRYRGMARDFRQTYRKIFSSLTNYAFGDERSKPKGGRPRRVDHEILMCVTGVEFLLDKARGELRACSSKSTREREAQDQAHRCLERLRVPSDELILNEVASRLLRPNAKTRNLAYYLTGLKYGYSELTVRRRWEKSIKTS